VNKVMKIRFIQNAGNLLCSSETLPLKDTTQQDTQICKRQLNPILKSQLAELLCGVFKFLYMFFQKT